MLKLEDFKAAKKRVDEVIDETRLIHSEAFSNECGNDVYIKPENLQKTGAFKIRGAYNKIIKLDVRIEMRMTLIYNQLTVDEKKQKLIIK